METLNGKVVADGLVFGEGIRWHAGSLWISDMFGGKVYRIDEHGEKAVVLERPQRPSGLAFAGDGALRVVSMTDQLLLRVHDGEAQVVADLSGLLTGEANDLVVSTRGHAYVSSFGFDLFGGEALKTACIALVDADGRARVAADDLVFPNGMVITPDGATLIVAETFANRLTAFDIDADGGLSNRRVHAELGERTPDGICLDADGAVWASSFETGEFVRVLPGGEVTHLVRVDGAAVTCTLGGPQRRTLYAVAAQTTPQRLAAGDSRSWILQVEAPVAGAGLP